MSAKDFLPLVKGPVDKLFTLVSDEVKQLIENRLLEYQCEEYNRCLYSKTLLNRGIPKSLDDFYIPLYLQNYTGSIDNTRNLQRFSTQTAKEVFALTNRITIIGTAGSGKSTLIKYLVVKCVDEGLKIPIRIELRYLNSFTKGGIFDFITQEIFQFQKLGVTTDKVDSLLDKGIFAFFFDGYDEVSSAIRSTVANDIDMFTKKYFKNNYIVTSRPYADIELLPQFRNYNISTLIDNEIEEFVRKQLPNDEVEIADKIIKAIKAPENKGYRSFLNNPLLLSMFILTFQSYAEIPTQKSIFYDQVFETLFVNHDSMSKMGYTHEKRSGLAKQQFISVLSLFSFVSLFEDKIVFTSTYFNEKLDYTKKKLLDTIFDNDLLINDLQLAIGIINKEGTDYTFPHRSLQEYFAALYIKQLTVDQKIKFYGKMVNSFQKDYRLISSKLQFYITLAEIDPIYCLQFFTLPVVESAWLEAKKSFRQKELYYYYSLVLLSILWTTDFKKVFKDLPHLFINKSSYPTPFTSLNDTLEDAIITGFREDELNASHFQMIEMSTKFKKSGESIVNYFKDFLTQIRKNEADVIDDFL